MAGADSVEKLEDVIVRSAEQVSGQIRAAKDAISTVIFGQERVIENTLVTILSGGHALLIGVPGLAKTKLVETLGITLGLDAKRIQFTPDLMPSDILGAEVLDESSSGKRSFRFISGPVFAQLLMADEINRASPRTQSALLQAMQEQHITVAGARHDLPKPFHVLATQNPLEQEGTYPLPEAQRDRFLMQVDVDYPDREAERKILFDTTGAEESRAKPAMTAEDLMAAQRLVRRLPVGESVVAAILALVRSARPGAEGDETAKLIAWGPSPRASQALMLAVRARSLLEGRFAPSIADVVDLPEPILKHRLAFAAAIRESRMIAGLPLGFAQPLVLLGLLDLPALWWLLRLIPPRPRQIAFPPTRLLFDIAPREETPARTPWWLTLLRLALAALMIFAVAGPLWNPPLATATKAAPIALLLDDAWGAAATWDIRLRTADELIARAEADGRGVAIVPLSEPGRDISLETPGAARVRLRQILPKPHTLDRGEALGSIARFLQATPQVELIWLTDGIDLGNGEAFISGLARLLDGRPITVVAGGIKPAHALAAADNAAGALSVQVLRAATGAPEAGLVRALDLKGLPLGDARFEFKPEERQTAAQFDLPVEIRNDIARLEIAAERSSGAVQLLDKRWRRRSVGLVSGATSETAQPLLDAVYYLSRALNPFADVRVAEGRAPAREIERFLEQNLPMLILADVGNVVGGARDQLIRWVEDGGVLVRFAGPRLAAAEADDDDLVPVKLRRGGRTLGGSLTWEKPQQLAAFSREGPFFGMPVPGDVAVTRQVLAEPDSDLGDRTWATLADGTPLVTAVRRGRGLIVLFHVTADTRWSNLPLSGTFVDMLKRIVGLAGSTAAAEPEG